MSAQTDALEAVLLFHSASPWTEAKKTQWWNLTQTNEATTRDLCDTVRFALGRLPSCFGDFTGRLPSELPPDLLLSQEQRAALERLADKVSARPAKKLSGDVLVSAAYSTACFTETGEQIPELQKGLLELWAEHAERLGYDPGGIVVVTPHGRWVIFRTTDGGWNWELAAPKTKP